MKAITNGRATLGALMAIGLAAAAPVHGQVEDDTSYDSTITIEIRGEVAKLDAVPGGVARVHVVAPDSNGATQQWIVALGKAADLRKAGITPFTFAPGVQITITGNPGTNASEHRLRAQKVATGDGFVWTR